MPIKNVQLSDEDDCSYDEQEEEEEDDDETLLALLSINIILKSNFVQNK